MPTLFKRPTSTPEVHQLQRDTTELLHDHRVKVALNKLCPCRKSESVEQTLARRDGLRATFKSDADLIAAAGRPDKTTAATYQKRGLGVVKAAQKTKVDVWEVVEKRSKSVDSWYTCKAAVQFFLTEQIAGYKQLINTWYAERRPGVTLPANPVPRSHFEAALTYLPFFASALAATPEGHPPSKFGEGGHKRGLNSKSGSITRRPDDWREQLASTMFGDMKLLFLIQCVTGCRPIELQKGVQVVLTANDELLFSVNGAKLSKHAGQSLRAGRIGAKEGIAGELAKLLTVALPVESAPLIGKVDTYRKMVARCAEKHFPSKEASRRVTAYSVRHQMRTDLRSSGVSREETAEMMGHATTKSATYYGTGGRAGKGAVKLRQVSATRPVKQRAAHRPKNKRAAVSVAPSAARKPKPRT